MTYKNYKISNFGLCFFIPTIMGSLVFGSVSCAQDSEFVWTGAGKTFIVNYDKFPSPTVQSSEVLNSYFGSNNFQNMFCQDVVFKMNNEWTLWSPALVLQYKITASNKNDRLSWDLKVLNDQQDVLLWWTITSLKYQWILRQNGTSSIIEIIPVNVEISNSNYVVKDEFWSDPVFDMVIKHRSSADDLFWSQEFSCKTAIFERDDINEIIDFLCFRPYYYEGVSVEE